MSASQGVCGLVTDWTEQPRVCPSAATPPCAFVVRVEAAVPWRSLAPQCTARALARKARAILPGKEGAGPFRRQ